MERGVLVREGGERATSQLILGGYQHCSEKYLHRYLAEFDFRYNHRVALGYNDGERAVLAMKGIKGKRLTYRPINAKVS